MAKNSILSRFIEKAKQRDSYWVERAKLDFSLALEEKRKQSGLTYADIARRIESSAAYITKVFRGDSNMTIESMVKLSRAVGGSLRIEIVPEKAVAEIWTPPVRKLTVVQSHTALSATVVQRDDNARPAANDNILAAA